MTTITQVNRISKAADSITIPTVGNGAKSESEVKSIVEVVLRHASERPNDVAIHSWDGTLSYGELATAAARLARHLHLLDVGPDVLVPIVFHKSKWAVVSQLAILWAGAAFVPIDPSQPRQRLMGVLESVTATISLVSDGLEGAVSGLIKNVYVVSEETHQLLPDCDLGLPGSLSPEAAAYVLFTSGSTGKPKGCVISHLALAHIVHQTEALRINSDSRVLQFSSYVFTVSMVEIYASLAAGATICIPSDEDRLNRLSAFMEDVHVSWALLTPSMATTLSSESGLPTLRTLVLGGEPMSQGHFQKWSQRVELLLGFGLTEWAGACCVSSRITSSTDINVIGRPPTAQVGVVDPEDHRTLVPVGSVGELCIQGTGLFQGYLNNSAGGDNIFTEPPPWLEDTKGEPPSEPHRWYRTGDLVRYRLDGALEYVCRKDLQVKISGKRLVLTEVEHQASLVSIPGERIIAEAATPTGSNSIPVLVAFCYSPEYQSENEGSVIALPSESFRSRVAKIQASIHSVLPDHMWPSFYLPLRSIPLTITGKIARRKLREIIGGSTLQELGGYMRAHSPIEMPVTDKERILHLLFAEVLELEPSSFGVQHGLIRLGGNSIQAMRLVNRCREEGYSLTVSDILGEETITLLSHHLNRATQTHTPSQEVVLSDRLRQLSLGAPDLESLLNKHVSLGEPLDIEAVEDVYACSPIQTGMLLSQLRYGHHYELQVFWEISPVGSGSAAVDPCRLQEAWWKLCQRHAMLRTLVCNRSIADPIQIVLKSLPTHQFAVLMRETADLHDMLKFSETEKRPHARGLPYLGVFVGNSSVRACLQISHLLIDAASMSIIMRDLASLYNEQAGEISSISPVPCNYRHYVEYLADYDQHESHHYWQEYLKDASACYFPCRQGFKEPSGGLQYPRTIPVPVESWDMCYDFAKANGLTMASIFKLAWGLVLRCYVDCSHVCFGYAVSGRGTTLEGISDAVGPFVNILTCQILFHPGQTLLQTLQQVQLDGIRALNHQYVALGEARASCGPSAGKLFNTAVTFPPTVPSTSHLQEQGIQITELGRIDPTEYDIVLEVQELGDQSRCTMSYYEYCLSDEQANRLAATFYMSVQQIVRRAHLPIAQVDLLSDQDRALLTRWNHEERMESEHCVHELIQAQCSATSTACAIYAWDGQWTYSELDDLSSRIAHRLMSHGVGPEVLVPICLTPSRWVPVAMLGVLKAGGAIALLDVSHPVSRLQEICSQLAGPVVLTSPQSRHIAEQLCNTVIDISNECFDWVSPTDPTKDHLTPHNALYVVFTSGSTGTPKGVVIEHHSFCKMAHEMVREYRIRPQERVLQLASHAFDAILLEYLAPLMTGACVCVPSGTDRRNRLAESIDDFQATWLFITPAVLRILQPEDVPRLETILVGGEPVRPSDTDPWVSKVCLFIMYGPSECTVMSTGFQCLDPTGDASKIGQALGSLSTWIVHADNHDLLVPIGAVGELLLEGPGVGRGYLHASDGDPAFLPQPPQWRDELGSRRTSRFYKTGDLVRYTSNGDLQFVGRKDTQVKLSGQRIELSAVESAIRSALPRGSEVVVEMVQHKIINGKTQLLVACIHDPGSLVSDQVQRSLFRPVTDEFASLTESLSEHLCRTLPRYMVPSIFVALTHVPLSRTGKIERKHLRESIEDLTPEQLELLVVNGGQHIPITTTREEALQMIISQVLNLRGDRIWADSHFLQLGGDSISAMAVARSARQMGLSITVEKIFQYPRLADMARCACPERLSSEEIGPFSLLGPKTAPEWVRQETAQICGLKTCQIEDIYPATPMQEGLMALTSQNHRMYWGRLRYDVPATTDLARLQEAWQSTVDTTPILRTRIIRTSEGTFQVVVSVVASVIDWRQMNSLDDVADEEHTPSMGIGGPLIQFSWASQLNGGWQLLLTMHHAIYDGVSLQTILRRVESSYQGQTLRSSPFTPFVKQLAHGDPLLAENYWRAQFSEIDAPIFPSLPPSVHTPEPDSWLSRAVTIPALPEKKTGTLSNIIRLAWAITVSQYTDSNDIVFGALVSGRNVVPDDLCGPTITTVPCRIKLVESLTIEDTVAAVQAQATQMIPFEQTGVQNIRRLSEEAAAACQFQCYIAAQLPTTATRDITLMAANGSRLDYRDFASYALVLVFHLPEQVRENQQIQISAMFDTRALAEEDAARLLCQVDHVLCRILENPTKCIRDIKAEVCVEDMQQLSTWNGNLPTADSHTIHELVLQHADEQPDKVAVSFGSDELTFGQLRAESFQLAEDLIAVGVQRGTVVPLCFEKSTATVVAMLATMIAGGTCANMDPALPSARIQQMLTQLQPILILSSPAQHIRMEEIVDNPGIVHTLSANSRLLPSPSCRDTHTKVPAGPTDPAFILFTSGSTGTPKAIVMEHVHLATSIYYHAEALAVTRDTRALQFAAYAFDASLYETFTPLVRGSSVFIPSEHQRMSDLAAYITQHSIDWALLPPSASRILEPTDVPTLRTLVVGGEAVTQEVINTWAPHLQLINAYGPAEATICSAGPIPVTGWRSGCIGPILGGVGWVTSSSNPEQLLPIGATGELLIEGAVVTREYLGNTEATRERFIEAPKWLQKLRNGEPGRVFRSGDLVRFTSEGWIRFVGRADTLVKLRGQRIELSEVEFHVQKVLPRALDTVAEIVPGKSPTLVAFVSGQAAYEEVLFAPPSTQFHVEISAARQKLRDILPSYMVPALFLPLGFIPRTKSGKIDRKRLRDATKDMSRAQWQEYQDPTRGMASQEESIATSTEKTLQSLWAAALSIRSAADIRRDDNFFELGGDSISAMSLVSASRRSGLDISVVQVLENPRLCDMASLLDQRARSFETRSSAPPSSPGSDQNSPEMKGQACDQEQDVAHLADRDRCDISYPLTPIQEVFFRSNPDGHHHYTLSALLRCSEQINALRARTAAEVVVGRHDMLRARFQRRSTGQWMQYITEEELHRSFLFQQHEVDDQEGIPGIVARSIQTLDIQKGPLFTVSLITDHSEDRQYISLVTHHLAVDNISLFTIIDDLSDCLQAGGVSEAPTMSFLHWSERQVEFSAKYLPPSQVLAPEDLKVYHRLCDAETLAYWGPQPMLNTSVDAQGHHFVLSQATTDTLLRMSNASSFPFTAPTELIQGCLLYAFVQTFSDRPTPLIFVGGHGRETWDPQVDISQTVGWFTTLSPSCVDLSPEDTLSDAIQRTAETRRRTPRKGWDYFSSRYLNPEGRQVLDCPMEIIFNYNGQAAQRPGAFLEVARVDRQGMIGDDVQRFSLINVNAFVVDGALQVDTWVNRWMNHQDALARWVTYSHECVERALAELVA